MRILGPRTAAGLVFLTSGAVLVLEILSLRLVAPYVGLTLQTNSSVIGMALAAIATGAWLGGRAADLVPPPRLLGPLVMGGGLLTLAVLPLVRWTGELVRGGDPSSVLLVSAVAVFAPAALLAAVSPVVVKMQLATLAETGTVVGRLSGVGTLGAIAATFITGFVLIAMVSTSVILLCIGGLLVLVGAALMVYLRQPRAVPLAVTLVLALTGGAATVYAPQTCDLETAYHCAKVVADAVRPDGRRLELDTLPHSYVDLHDPTYLEYSYVRAIAAATDVMRPAGSPITALHLGGGGLTLPRYVARARPGSENLVIEIDAGVLALNRSRLGLRTGEGLQTRVQDARLGVERAPTASRDLVVGDAFGGVAVPWHLTTREMVAQVRRVLVDDGLYAVNVIDYPPLRFARAEVATIAAEFDHVAIVSYPEVLARRAGGNVVVLASDRPLPVDALRRRLGETSSELAVLSDRAGIARFVGRAGVLTDDFAPVDQLLTVV